jgi:uncharacterized membrane protein
MQPPKKVLMSGLQNLALISITFSLINVNSGRLSNAPFVYSIIALLLGLMVGLFVKRRSVKKRLRRIEHMGYYKPDQPPNVPLRIGIPLLLTTLMCLVMVVALTIYVLFKAPFWLFTFNFFVGILVALQVTEIVYYWHWQHKNKRILLIADNILYPSPYMNQSTNKETAT